MLFEFIDLSIYFGKLNGTFHVHLVTLYFDCFFLNFFKKNALFIYLYCTLVKRKYTLKIHILKYYLFKILSHDNFVDNNKLIIS